VQKGLWKSSSGRWDV